MRGGKKKLFAAGIAAKHPTGCPRFGSVVKRIMCPLELARLKEHLTLELTPEPPAADLVAAGVLVPLFVQDGNLRVLLIQRTLLVRDHRGQMAFPGGVRDPEDSHLLATALRETSEELGLAPGTVEILGSLAKVATLTGYQITPFVGLIPFPCDFQPSPQEVERLLTYELTEFYPPERWSSGPYIFQGRTTRVCYWQNGEEVVWGATARILLNLLTHLGVFPIPGDYRGTCLD